MSSSETSQILSNKHEDILYNMVYRAHFRVTMAVVSSSSAVVRLDAMRNIQASSTSFV